MMPPDYKRRVQTDAKIFTLAEWLVDNAEPRSDAERARYTERIAEALQIAFENEIEAIAVERKEDTP